MRFSGHFGLVRQQNVVHRAQFRMLGVAELVKKRVRAILKALVWGKGAMNAETYNPGA